MLAPLLGVIMVFVLTALDPLGFESVTKAQSARIFYKIYAAAYPVATRDKISVVLLDNKTVEETFNDSWPPSHLVHRSVLEAILSYKPAAVLVDMFFFHEAAKQDFEHTKEIFGKYKAKHVPLFLTVADPGSGAHRIGLREMYDPALNVRMVSAELEGEPGEPPLYPLQAEESNWPAHLRPDLAGRRPTGGSDDDDGLYEPAALAIYHAICGGTAKLGADYNPSLGKIREKAKCADTLLDGWMISWVNWLKRYILGPIDEQILTPFGVWLALTPDIEIKDNVEPKKQMEVVWGLHPAAINCQRSETHSDVSSLGCKDFGVTWLGRAIELFWMALIPPHHRDTDPIVIPYHAEISSTDVLKGENHRTLSDYLAGKVVIYSSQVAPRKDFVFSPVHGNIEGAFIHAMALDNLLTWGEQSIILRAPEGWFYKTWTEFQPTILMAFVSLLIYSYRRYQVRAGSSAQTVELLRYRDERFLTWGSWLLYLLILATALIEFRIFRTPPFNWLGLLIVVHIAHRVDRWFFRVVEKEAEDAGWDRHPATRRRLSEISEGKAA